MADEWYDRFKNRMRVSDDYDRPEMNAAAWDKMQAKLDVAFAKKKKRRRFFWIFLLPLLAGGAWVFGLLLPLASNQKSTASRHGAPALAGADATALATEKPDVQKNTQSESRPSAPPTARIDFPASGLPVKSSGKATQATAKEKPAVAEPMQEYQKKQTQPVNDAMRREATVAAYLLEGVNSRPATQQNLRAPKAAKQNAESQSSRSVYQISTRFPFHQPLTFRAPLAAVRTPLMKNEDGTTKKARDAGRSRLQLFAGVTAMQTVSGVALSRTGAANLRYGVHAGLKLKRFSLSGGLAGGNVRYAAQGNEYRPKHPYNSYGYTLKDVDAVCYILDVPVTLAYEVYTKKKFALTAGVGLVSQLMKRETYNYTYVRNAMVWKGTWSYKGANKHVLSSAQVHAGVQYQMGSGLFLQANPFFGAPLKGIGQGRVRLQSAGLQASLNYFPFGSRKQ